MALRPAQAHNGPPTVVFLMGPTGAGKTELAVELATRRDCDIISVDSALVYRGMDIGTAKPDPEILSRVPHSLIDVCDPSEAYSAARFRSDASAEIESILDQGRTPLLVGGTMLYFRALAYGLSALPTADASLRQALELQGREQGWASMHERLLAVDPQAGRRIHPNDPQRILRALEVYEMTGTPLSALQGRTQPLPYRIIRLVVAPAERRRLHRRIEQRFQAMMSNGFLDEVERLYRRKDLNIDLPSMRAVGYRQLWAHLAGDTSLETAIQRGIIATRQLAKRQLTWLRSEPEGTKWFDGDDKNMLDNVLKTLDDAQ